MNRSFPSFYFALDKTSNDLLQVVLQPNTEGTGAERGDRSVQDVAGTCDFSGATAAMFVRPAPRFTGRADLNGDGDVDDDGEGEVGTSNDADHFAALLVASDNGDLLRVDLLSNSCENLLPGAFVTDANIVSMDAIVEETPIEVGEPVETRVLRVMALDADMNQLHEIICRQDDVETNEAALTCDTADTVVHDISLNQPVSPAAVSMSWSTRRATILDDELNSTFLVDLAPRDASTAAPIVGDFTTGDTTGQAVILSRGLNLNCDPVSDEPGCRNL